MVLIQPVCRTTPVSIDHNTTSKSVSNHNKVRVYRVDRQPDNLILVVWLKSSINQYANDCFAVYVPHESPNNENFVKYLAGDDKTYTRTDFPGTKDHHSAVYATVRMPRSHQRRLQQYILPIHCGIVEI